MYICIDCGNVDGLCVEYMYDGMHFHTYVCLSCMHVYCDACCICVCMYLCSSSCIVTVCITICTRYGTCVCMEIVSFIKKKRFFSCCVQISIIFFLLSGIYQLDKESRGYNPICKITIKINFMQTPLRQVKYRELKKWVIFMAARFFLSKVLKGSLDALPQRDSYVQLNVFSNLPGLVFGDFCLTTARS